MLTATAGYLQITVSWPAVATATSYEIWAWDGTWTQLMNNGAAITGTSHTHTGLTAGRTYYYQGRAVNANGTMSAWSAQVSATVLSSPNISMPTSFSAARGDTEMITLTWGSPGQHSRPDYRQLRIPPCCNGRNWMPVCLDKRWQRYDNDRNRAHQRYNLQLRASRPVAPPMLKAIPPPLRGHLQPYPTRQRSQPRPATVS